MLRTSGEPLTYWEMKKFLERIKFRNYEFELSFDGMSLKAFARFDDRKHDAVEQRPVRTVAKMDEWSSLPTSPAFYPEYKTQVKVQTTWSIPAPDSHNALRTQEDLIRFVYGMILALEDHEIRENFYYGGERILDPHNPDCLKVEQPLPPLAIVDYGRKLPYFSEN